MPAFSFRDLASKLQINYTEDELSHYNYGFGVSLNDRKVRNIIRMNHLPYTSSSSAIPPLSIQDVDPVSIGGLNGLYAIPVPDWYDENPLTLTIARSNAYSYGAMYGYDETTGTRLGNQHYDADYYLWEGTARVRALYLKQLTNVTHTNYDTVGTIKYELRCEIARTNFSSNPGTPAGYYSWWATGNKRFSYAHAVGPGLGGWGSYYNSNTGYWHQFWSTNNDWGYSPIERYSYGSSDPWQDIYWRAVKWTTSYVGFGKTKISAN